MEKWNHGTKMVSIYSSKSHCVWGKHLLGQLICIARVKFSHCYGNENGSLGLSFECVQYARLSFPLGRCDMTQATCTLETPSMCMVSLFLLEPIVLLRHLIWPIKEADGEAVLPFIVNPTLGKKWWKGEFGPQWEEELTIKVKYYFNTILS